MKVVKLPEKFSSVSPVFTLIIFLDGNLKNPAFAKEASS